MFLLVFGLPMLGQLGARIRERFAGGTANEGEDGESKKPGDLGEEFIREVRRAAAVKKERETSTEAHPIPRARPASNRPDQPPVAAPVRRARPAASGRSTDPPTVAHVPKADPRRWAEERRRRAEIAKSAEAIARAQEHSRRKPTAPKRAKSVDAGAHYAEQSSNLTSHPSEPAEAARRTSPRVTAHSLREAVILSEVLRPPLALRDPDENSGVF